MALVAEFCLLSTMFWHCNGIKVRGQSVERAEHLGSTHCAAMASHDQLGSKACKSANRLAGALPIRGEIHRRAMHLRGLSKRGINRFLPGGNKRVADNQGLVGFAPKWRCGPGNGRGWATNASRTCTAQSRHPEGPAGWGERRSGRVGTARMKVRSALPLHQDPAADR